MCTFGIRAYNMAKQSQQEKWKGVFGRLKNCKRYKKGFSVKASNGSLESTCEFMKDVEIGNVSSREIRAWGDSFERLMSSDSGRKVFRAFLRCEYSEENILFWLACEDLKNEPSPELIEEKARIIYEDYVSILSPREVSLDSRVREIINQNMISPSQQTFNEAQLQIYTLMHRDSYPRFVNSSTYRDLLKTCGSNPNDENEDGKSIHNASELSSR
ncbi:RGS [Lepeophtheirus salmonis]|uniref:RGS n=1 Tax=Lepeophtheirus salmonis TaxID=72036 RepID=A0A7R8CUJ5_LEPSM|nr:regulator of G-protein signaling 20-like isoform X1 [Lepeophtheirus salmonis]CAB4064145.1 RGS [Lepeophtheirus salmonis]CAF2936819.1 RGS [Lepeophtheirus salmonis]